MAPSFHRIVEEYHRIYPHHSLTITESSLGKILRNLMKQWPDTPVSEWKEFCFYRIRQQIQSSTTSMKDAEKLNQYIEDNIENMHTGYQVCDGCCIALFDGLD